MKNDFKSVKEILKEYDPIEEFKRKHGSETDEDFEEWLNK